jgi:hypothetical protein
MHFFSGIKCINVLNVQILFIKLNVYLRYDNHEGIHHPGKEEGEVTTSLFKAGIRTIQTN